ncbi:MAG: MauE/DoxX family redox-associated membrane protein [Candidatus Sumerlaeia bacterium]
MKRYTFATTVLGVIFLVSAIAKAVDVKSFALLISYFNVMRDTMLVSGTAVLIILFEFILGMSLIVRNRYESTFIKITLAALACFSGIIVYGWIFMGLQDCGCFGSFIKMSPLASLFKNGVLMGVAGFALLQHKKYRRISVPIVEYPQRRVFKLATVCLSTIMPTALMGWSYFAGSTKPQDPNLNAQTSESTSDRIFAQFKVQDNKRNMLDLGQGRYFVAFLSDSCGHCQDIVSDLNEFPHIYKDLPVIGLILGDENTLREFRERFLPQFPTAILEPLKFFEFIGNAPPRYYLVQDGKTQKYWDNQLPKPEEIKKLISQ